MKKLYSKPLISVEAMTMDAPIAANCTARKDDIKVLMQWGYFMEGTGYTCNEKLYTDGDKVDTNFDGELDEHDTICYHSNIEIAFLS